MKIPSLSSLSLTASGMLIPALAAFAARKAAGKGYSAVKHQRPPRNPDRPEVEWREALVWTVLSGAICGVARLGVRRWLARSRLPLR